MSESSRQVVARTYDRPKHLTLRRGYWCTSARPWLHSCNLRPCGVHSSPYGWYWLVYGACERET